MTGRVSEKANETPDALPRAQLKRVADAAGDVEVAQHEVERAMNALKVSIPRAQKTLISDALRRAFVRLAEARAKLEELSGRT